MKQAVKLILKCFLVLLPVTVMISFFWKNPLAFVDSEALYYLWNKEVANATQEKYYKVIILGDSVANAAYVPEILSDDTLNLSLAGSTPMENYYTLQDWLSHNEAPQICYISFQDFHFQLEGCFWTRTMYSHRYRLDQEIEMLNAAINYNEPSIVQEHYLLDFISYELRLPNKYITSFMNASFNQRHKDNIVAQQSVELHSGNYMARGVNEYKSDEAITYTGFSVNPLFDAYYRKIVELCQENNIAVRIIKLPLPNITVYTDDYENSFYSYYESLKNDYPDITVDWFNNYEKECFADSVHMNSHGALRFSTELKALYPDDFGDAELSPKQVKAINDSIKAENKIEEILKWICGRDYTVVVCDKRASFQSIYNKEIAQELGVECLELSSVDSLQEENGICIYTISGMSSNKLGFDIQPSEVGVEILLIGGGSQKWTVVSDTALGVIVIDNYNNNVVCTKTFQYVNDLFTLA